MVLLTGISMAPGAKDLCIGYMIAHTNIRTNIAGVQHDYACVIYHVAISSRLLQLSCLIRGQVLWAH